MQHDEELLLGLSSSILLHSANYYNPPYEYVKKSIRFSTTWKHWPYNPKSCGIHAKHLSSNNHHSYTQSASLKRKKWIQENRNWSHDIKWTFESFSTGTNFKSFDAYISYISIHSSVDNWSLFNISSSYLVNNVHRKYAEYRL